MFLEVFNAIATLIIYISQFLRDSKTQLFKYKHFVGRPSETPDQHLCGTLDVLPTAYPLGGW